MYQVSVPVANAFLDAMEAQIGASAKLQLRTGAPPAHCGSASTGTLIVQMTLPADWMANAASAIKTLLGVWSGAAIADSNVTPIAHFRIFDNALAVCGMQGTVTISGGGGDMIADTVSVLTGQVCTVTQFTLAAGNA